MEFSILNNKNTTADGRIDLLSNVVVVDYESVVIDDMILIDDMTEMSLDLIAFVKYGSENYTDVLMKFNRLSNPLSLMKGMVIAVPNLLSFEKHTKLINIKPIQLQSKKSIFSAFAISKVNSNTPSTKNQGSRQNFRKDANGNIIF